MDEPRRHASQKKRSWVAHGGNRYNTASHMTGTGGSASRTLHVAHGQNHKEGTSCLTLMRARDRMRLVAMES